MVLHPEACWGGLPTRVQKTKIYNLETGEFASTPPFSKKHLAGAISQYTFGGNFSKTIWRELFQKNIWREFFKKYLAGTFKTHIWREQFQKHIWREHFGGNILRGPFFFII
jgi:hypothetical protein